MELVKKNFTNKNGELETTNTNKSIVQVTGKGSARQKRVCTGLAGQGVESFLCVH